MKGLAADVPRNRYQSFFPQREDCSVSFWVRERGIANVYESTGKSSRCPSFLAGESVKGGQKHGNIKRHTPTNRPNKKDLGSLLKKWEHADVIPPTPFIRFRAPEPGSGLSWKARRPSLSHRRMDVKRPDWDTFGFDSSESQKTQQCEVQRTFDEFTGVWNGRTALARGRKFERK